MTDTIKMPKELTAENGAKGLLSGEFFETVTMECGECIDGGAEDGCEVCDGNIKYQQKVTVSWTTIKEIYAMAVKHLGSK